jgi:hypothetical protein
MVGGWGLILSGICKVAVSSWSAQRHDTPILYTRTSNFRLRSALPKLPTAVVVPNYVPTPRHIPEESTFRSRRWGEINNRPKYVSICVKGRTKAI